MPAMDRDSLALEIVETAHALRRAFDPDGLERRTAPAVRRM